MRRRAAASRIDDVRVAAVMCGLTAGTACRHGGIRVGTENHLGVIVLGIDPGLAATGYGVVAQRGGRLVALDGGVIDTPAGCATAARLASIHARVGELMAEHDPASLALEALYFGQNVRTAFAVGQARGVVLLAAGQRGIDCVDYTPQQVKGSVCGA